MAILSIMIYSILFNPLISGNDTGSICGTVTDERGYPLIGATVMVVGTSYGAMTNQNGSYQIINLAVGVYSVQAIMVGMRALTAEGVAVLADTSTPLSFELEQWNRPAGELPIIIEI